MRLRVKWPVSLATLMLLVAPDSSSADPRDPPAQILIGLGTHVRSFETMSYSDIRPVTHGEYGGRAEIGLRITGRWWASLAGHFGGAWFDYASPDLGSRPPFAGKIEDFSWLIRGGLDHRRGFGRGSTAYVGLGGEYGESRSWLDATDLSDEGPHVFLGGGYFKVGAERPLLGAVHGYAEAHLSAYHAHSRRGRFQTVSNWLGRSMEAGIGLRVML